MIERLDLVARWVQQVKAARAVAMVEGPIQQRHPLCLEVLVPGVQFLDAVDDEAVMIHQRHTVALGISAAERQVVVAAGQVDQILVGAVQQLHAQHVHVETLARFQVGYRRGQMAQVIEARWALNFLHSNMYTIIIKI